MKTAVIILIRVYQIALSPVFHFSCRFYPSCSEYMRQSVQKWGAARGIWMGIIRLSKCHPFHPGGYDPV